MYCTTELLFYFYVLSTSDFYFLTYLNVCFAGMITLFCLCLHFDRRIDLIVLNQIFKDKKSFRHFDSSPWTVLVVFIHSTTVLSLNFCRRYVTCFYFMLNEWLQFNNVSIQKLSVGTDKSDACSVVTSPPTSSVHSSFHGSTTATLCSPDFRGVV